METLSKIDKLIDEKFVMFCHNSETKDYAFSLKPEGQARRILSLEEMPGHMYSNTEYGKYFRKIIFEVTCEILKLLGTKAEEILGEKEKKLDILYELASNNPIFDESLITIGILATMPLFRQKRVEKKENSFFEVLKFLFV